MFLKSIVFVNMMSNVGGLPFVAWMKPKSNILDTLRALGKFWGVLLRYFMHACLNVVGIGI